MVQRIRSGLLVALRRSSTPALSRMANYPEFPVGSFRALVIYLAIARCSYTGHYRMNPNYMRKPY